MMTLAYCLNWLYLAWRRWADRIWAVKVWVIPGSTSDTVLIHTGHRYGIKMWLPSSPSVSVRTSLYDRELLALRRLSGKLPTGYVIQDKGKVHYGGYTLSIASATKDMLYLVVHHQQHSLCDPIQLGVFAIPRTNEGLRRGFRTRQF